MASVCLKMVWRRSGHKYDGLTHLSPGLRDSQLDSNETKPSITSDRGVSIVPLQPPPMLNLIYGQ